MKVGDKVKLNGKKAGKGDNYMYDTNYIIDNWLINDTELTINAVAGTRIVVRDKHFSMTFDKTELSLIS